MTVYVVTSGEYSDFHIDTICSTEALAEDYRRKWRMEDRMEITEWTVDEDAEKVMRREYSCLIRLSDGEIAAVDDEDRFVERTAQAPEVVEMWLSTGHLRVCSFFSAEHARKLAVEARQAYLRRAIEEGAP